MAFYTVPLGIVISIFGLSCQSPSPNLTPMLKESLPSLAVTTGRGDVVIYDPELKEAFFMTQSGVLFKSVSLTKPEVVTSYKSLKTQIHNSSDSLFVSVEWIADKIYWNITTNKLNTHHAIHIGLTSYHDSEVIRLCTECRWISVFDSSKGKTTAYIVTGITTGISIDEWNAVYGITYDATAVE